MFVYYWIDVIWLPIAFFLVHKKHRWWSIGFVVSCMVFMRLQVELMEFIGYPNGILKLISADVNARMLMVYSIFYMLFLIMAHYSPKTEGVVFMGACLGIFFMLFVVSSLIMVL
jgi:hypothetical protein